MSNEAYTFSAGTWKLKDIVLGRANSVGYIYCVLPYVTLWRSCDSSLMIAGLRESTHLREY